MSVEEVVEGINEDVTEMEWDDEATVEQTRCQKLFPYMGIFIFLIIFPDFPGPHSDSKSFTPRSSDTSPDSSFITCDHSPD